MKLSFILKMEFVVDIQGFKTKNEEFIFKEVAVVVVQEDAIPTVFHFLPPHHWNKLPVEYKNSNGWLENNFHGIPWSSDKIPYKKITEVLKEALKLSYKVYVKGDEKRRWLSKILSNNYICNLEIMGCPPLRQLVKHTSCSMHTKFNSHRTTCAVKNALGMKRWLLNDGQGIDKVDL